MADCPCSFPDEVAWPCVRHLIAILRGQEPFVWQDVMQHVACLAGSVAKAFGADESPVPVFGARAEMSDDQICEGLEEYDPVQGAMRGVVDTILMELLFQLIKRIIDRIGS